MADSEPMPAIQLSLDLATPSSGLAVGDFEGNGRPDLVYWQTSTAPDLIYGKGFQVMLQDGSSFGPHAPVFEGYPSPSSILYDVATGDINNDGRSDWLYAHSGSLSAHEWYYRLQRTEVGAPVTNANPAKEKVKVYADRAGTIAAVKSALHTGDPSKLFSEFSAIIPTASRTLLQAALPGFQLRAGDTLVYPTYAGHEIHRFIFDAINGDEVWWLEIAFEQSNLYIDNGEGEYVQDTRWAATRYSFFAPAVRFHQSSDPTASQFTTTKLPGNTHLDVLANGQWLELTPQAGGKPWSFATQSRQALPEINLQMLDRPQVRVIEGAPSLFVASGNRILRRVFSGSSFGAVSTVVTQGEWINQFTLGDVNDDKREDLVFSAKLQGSTAQQVYWMKQTSGGLFEAPVLLQTLRGDCGDIAIGDFDGDKRKDIVFIDLHIRDDNLRLTNIGRVGWIRALANNSFAPAVQFANEFYVADELAMGDFFGEGRERIAVRTNRSIIYDQPSGTSWRECQTLLLDYATFEKPVGAVWEPAGRAQGSMAFGPQGQLGLLLTESDSLYEPAASTDGERERLVFRERNRDGVYVKTETIIDFPPAMHRNYSDAALFYNAEGQPEVYTLSSGAILRWVRTESEWRYSETASLPLGLFEGAGSSFLQTLVPTQTADGTVHFALYAMNYGGTQRVVHAQRSTAGTWQWQVAAAAAAADTELNTLDAFEWPEFRHTMEVRNLSLAVDAGGRLHMVFGWGREIVPITGGSQVRSDLYYATNASGSWATETLHSPGSGYGDAGLGASVAVAPNGAVAVAASWIPRAPTGSPGSAQLLYFVKPPGGGSWSQSTLASAASSYAAGDGARGTGLFPRLLFDESSQAHVVFADHASQHFKGRGAFSFAGQVRYAKRASPTAGEWRLQTLVGRGSSAAIDFQTYDIDLAVKRGEVAVAATNYRWSGSSRAYKKEYFLSQPMSDDSDGDGLSDAAEEVAGTAVDEADTDGDGVPDGLDDQPLSHEPLRLVVGGSMSGFNLGLSPGIGVVTGASGLPPGVRFDSKTRTLVGAITDIKAASKPFEIQFTVKRPDGKTFKLALRLTVEALPAWLAGSYVAALEEAQGQLTLSVNASGAFTAKLWRGIKTYSLSGVLIAPQIAEEREEEAFAARAELSLNAKDPSQIIVLNLTFSPGRVAGSITHIEDMFDLAGWKQTWHARNNPAWDGVVRRPVHLALRTASETAGHGYAIAKISTAGVVSWSGRLGDGTSLTASAPLSPTGEGILYQALKTSGGGAVQAVLMFKRRESDGLLEVVSTAPARSGLWWKRPDPAGKERLEPSGFARALDVFGGEFVAPPSNTRLLSSSELELRLAGGGLASASAFASIPSMFSVTQNDRGTAFTPETNAVELKVVLKAKDGSLSGSWVLRDPVPGVTAPLTRKLAFQGLYVPGPDGDEGKAWGSFILPQIPVQGQKASATPILSGAVEFAP